MIQIGIVGGYRKDSDLRKLYQHLKKLLIHHTDKTYSESLNHLMIVFCISGEIKDYKFEGFDRLRINRKKQQIWVDYGIKKDLLLDKDETYIKEFLKNVVFEAIELLFRRLEKEELPFKKEDLLKDVKGVFESFMCKS